ncbi:PH domain-containing protein [Actinomycetes bacterium KLBMP 9797]
MTASLTFTDTTLARVEAYVWRVPRKVPLAKLAGAVLLLAVGLLLDDGDVMRLMVAAIAAVALAGWAVRDLVAPVRVAADATGVTVATGLAGRRHLAWSQIERVRVDARSHWGLQTAMLEIDAGDALHLFTERELGAPPAEVAAALATLRTAP